MRRVAPRSHRRILLAALPFLLTGCDLVDPETPKVGINETLDAWTEWIQENAQPIGSLTSGTPDEFEFLRPLLEDKRIVQVGALTSAHVPQPRFNPGREEHFQLATRLIPFLHEELGFDLFLCGRCGPLETYWAEQHVEELTPDRFFRVIAGEWFRFAAEPLLDYIHASHETARPLHMYGIDFGRAFRRGISERRDFLVDMVGLVDPAYAEEVFEMESDFLWWEFDRRSQVIAIPSDETGRFLDGYQELVDFLDANLDALVAGSDDPLAPLIARQTAWSAVQFVRHNQIVLEEGEEAGLRFREEAMAENLDFILDRIYPDQKVVLWDYNFRVRNDNPSVETDVCAGCATVGTLVAERRRSELYTLGVYHGGFAAGFRKSDLTLEGVMASAGIPFFFVDMSMQDETLGTSWMFNRRQVLEQRLDLSSGLDILVARDQYDGLFYIDEVTGAEAPQF